MPETTRDRNEVRLVGVLTTDPVERTTADDRAIVTFRLEVGRSAEDGGGRDQFDCSVVGARARRAAQAYAAGDLVDVQGAIRRRFYRGPAGSRPFVVIEATRVRRLADVTRPRTT